MNLCCLIPFLIILFITIIVLIVVPTSSIKSDKLAPKPQKFAQQRIDRFRFNQTKYKHNVTKSNGNANIINVEGECKLWNAENRVIGGMDAEMGELPCIALLEYLTVDTQQYSFGCAGSLINQRYVLTAAQCLYEKNLINVRLGEYDLNGNPDCDEDGDCQPNVINVGIERLTIHSNYSSTNHMNDMGLIRLSMDVPFADYFIRPICIPDETINTTVGVVVKIGGWGRYGSENKNSILRTFWVKIVDCQKFRSNINRSESVYLSQLCVGGNRKPNACNEDLGGPLLLRHNLRSYLAGVASFSSDCNKNDMPEVYTKVSYFYDWIRNNLEP